MMSIFFAAIAQVLSNASAEWLIAGIGAISFVAIGTNAVFGIAIKRKQLNAPVMQNMINPQPLIVAMEKEFVHRAEYERRHSDVESQIKEARKYAHDEIHAIRGFLSSMQLASEARDQLLHALDERTKTHTRQLDSVDVKIGRMSDRIADKIESVLREKFKHDG
jgi:signal transduction histidine kinase